MNIIQYIITIDKMYVNEFFEILVDHYKLYKQEGLQTNIPIRFQSDTKKFIEDNSLVTSWLNTNIEITCEKSDIIKSFVLYQNFLEYYDNDSHDISTMLFKEILMKNGIGSIRKNTGVYYTNVKLKKYCYILF